MLFNHNRVKTGIILGVPVYAMPVPIGHIHAHAVMPGELMKVKTTEGWAVAEYENRIIHKYPFLSFILDWNSGVSISNFHYLFF